MASTLFDRPKRVATEVNRSQTEDVVDTLVVALAAEENSQGREIRTR